jgi:hypothetical protein
MTQPRPPRYCDVGERSSTIRLNLGLLILGLLNHGLLNHALSSSTLLNRSPVRISGHHR